MLKYIGITKNLEDKKRISEQLTLAMSETEKLSNNKTEGLHYPKPYMVVDNVNMQDAKVMNKCLKVMRSYISGCKNIKRMTLVSKDNTIFVEDNENPKIVQLLSEKLENIEVKEIIEVKKPELKSRKHVDFVRYRISIMLPKSKGLHFLKMPYNVLVWAKTHKYPITSANNTEKDLELLRNVILWIR